MDTFADKKLINRKGKLWKAKDILRSKRLYVYIFCDAESENIVNILKKMKLIYEEGIRRSMKMEVIFASLDSDEKSMMTFFKTRHGNWYAIPFGDLAIGELIFKYGVSTKPKIIVVRSDGRVVTYQAEIDILNDGLNVLVVWSD